MRQEKKVCPQTYAKFMFFFILNHTPELFFLPRCTVHCTTLLMSSHVRRGRCTKPLLKPCHLNVTVYCKPSWKTLVCVPLAKRDTREQAGLGERGAQRAAHPRWICSVSSGGSPSAWGLCPHHQSVSGATSSATEFTVKGISRPDLRNPTAQHIHALTCLVLCSVTPHWPALESHPS